jgi:hypothetical protein
VDFNADGIYKRDLMKRSELVNWVLQYIKNPNVCEIIGNKINETIDKINKADSIFEADPLDSELRILDWIFIRFYSNKIIQIEVYNIK